MKTKLSSKFWLALTIFSLVGQIAWVIENMFLNTFIFNMFGADSQAIATMVAASAVAATLTTVFMGALSDKIGKRKLFMCGGYIVWGISILGFALVRTDLIAPIVPATMNVASVAISMVIVLDCLMTFFGSTANDAAFNAWLTDSTDDTNRGSAEGINAMMPLVAILVVFGGKMVLNMFYDDSNPALWTMFFAIVGVIVFLIGILGLFIIKDPDIKPSETSFWKNTVYGFLPSTMKRNVPFYMYLLCFILFNISIQIFMPYLMIYYEHSLLMSDYVMIMAPAIIVASVVTAFWGKVYDKKGFAFSCSIAFIWLCLGYILLYLFKDKALVFVGSLFMMCGYLAGMAVFGAKVRDLTPEGKAGMFQGVRIFAQVLVPGVIGPAIGSWILTDAERIVITGQETEIPNEKIFLGALIAAFVAIALMVVCVKIINNKKTLKEVKNG